MTHLYLGDRAMMEQEQAQENMQEVSRLNEDPLSRQSAELLRRLLEIEAEAADGHAVRAQCLVVETRTPSALPRSGEEIATEMHVPYFGLIKFAMDGIAAQTTRYPSRPIADLDTRSSSSAGASGADLGFSNQYVSSSTCSSFQESETAQSHSTLPSEYHDSEMSPPPHSVNGTLNAQPGSASDITQPSADVWNPMFMEGGFYDPLLPGLADTEEWSLEGVDMAYFGRLMGGVRGNTYSTQQVGQSSYSDSSM